MMKGVGMGRQDISLSVLRQVVTDLGPEFFTKDVSEDPRMTKVHFDLVGHTHYHSFVGGALSDHRVTLGINLVGNHPKRGGLWKKAAWSMKKPETLDQGSSPLAPAPTSQQEEQNKPMNHFSLGPQYTQDNLLARRMRKHQSWYRANVLNLPYGTGPGPNDTSFYGNMLTRVDGEAGQNFLLPEIFVVVRDRIAQGNGVVETYRLLHNMLSSQPMCFNLFGLLVRDHGLARTLLQTLVPERISDVTRVDIEWSPKPPSDYLNDHTAFDAFIEYRTLDGQQIGLGIETKLSEPFSQQVYDKLEYRRWMQTPDSPWLSSSWNKVQDVGHNQLWREHLLAVAMHTRPGSTYSQVRLMLVHHPEDFECVRNYLNYKKLLKDKDDSLFSLSLDQIVDRWLLVVEKEDHVNWLKSFKKRYLDLGLSDN
jgi:hypothetical protein